jgi:hypothetical protein
MAWDTKFPVDTMIARIVERELFMTPSATKTVQKTEDPFGFGR